MKLKVISLLFILSALAGYAQTSGECTRQTIFTANTDGYYIYRIPSLVATKKGTLLASCAARKGKGRDWDPIDIVMRRSKDGGKTWTPMQVIAHKDSLPCDNPTPIVDYQTGEVHMLYQIDYARCYYIKSTDEGQSWTEPADITPVIETFKKIYDWNVLAPGPGHGIQMTNGRLVVPFWLSTGGRSHRPSIVVSVYSDDHGRTWKAGDIVIHDNDTTVIPSETCCVQLADGRVMFNSRNESPNYRKLVTYSQDGVTGWSSPVFADAFFEPICEASMCRYSLKPNQSKDRILFCNPDSRYDPWIAQRSYTTRSAKNRHRTNLTIRMSYDEGHTWPVSKIIDPGIAGYSDIAVTPDGRIHCLYEGGSLSSSLISSHYLNGRITIVSFSLEWLTDGKDKLHKKDKPLNLN
ncbi:MAG: exo-alpha-sialidase [Mangrovibacterium sp.]